MQSRLTLSFCAQEKPKTTTAIHRAGMQRYEAMSKLKCTECGQVFDAELSNCPECGCPASECKQEADDEEARNESNHSKQQSSSPRNSIDLKNCALTAGYYQPWYNILQPWYIENQNPREQHRFDELNEFLLLGNLAFRVMLWWILFFWIVALCFMTIILGFLRHHQVLSLGRGPLLAYDAQTVAANEPTLLD